MEADIKGLGLNNESGTQLEALQKEHEEKTARIRELKRQIEATKAQLEKRKSEVPKERIQAFFMLLRDKYDKLREEYNAFLLCCQGNDS